MWANFGCTGRYQIASHRIAALVNKTNWNNGSVSINLFCHFITITVNTRNMKRLICSRMLHTYTLHTCTTYMLQNLVMCKISEYVFFLVYFCMLLIYMACVKTTFNPHQYNHIIHFLFILSKKKKNTQAERDIDEMYKKNEFRVMLAIRRDILWACNWFNGQTKCNTKQTNISVSIALELFDIIWLVFHKAKYDVFIRG